MKEALKIICDKKADFIDINVLYNNKVAICLYEKFGFKKMKLQMRKII